jgi:Na+/proline symporter
MSASTLGTIGLVGFLILSAISLTLALRLPRTRQVLTMAFFLAFAVFGVVALFSLIFFGKERTY